MAIQQDSWLADIIRAFRAAGGTAPLPKIYRWIQSNRRELPNNWQSVIRATIQSHSSDSPCYVNDNPDVFAHIGYGIWALRDPSGRIIERSDKALRFEVLSEMTKEEFELFRTNNELRMELARRIAKKRKQCRVYTID